MIPKCRYTSISLWLLFFVFPGLPSFSQEQPAIRPEEKVYKQINGVVLKAYVYYPPDYQQGKKYPVILFFFGGGWNSGKVSQFQQHSQYFARRGMIAVTADYRVASRHQTTLYKPLLMRKIVRALVTARS